jgi:hypothetical protein
MSKENPNPISELIALLGLPVGKKRLPRGISKMPRQQQMELRRNFNAARRKKIEALKKYKVGTYKEWEGDGYFKSSLYLYNGVYYG